MANVSQGSFGDFSNGYWKAGPFPKPDLNAPYPQYKLGAVVYLKRSGWRGTVREVLAPFWYRIEIDDTIHVDQYFDYNDAVFPAMQLLPETNRQGECNCWDCRETRDTLAAFEQAQSSKEKEIEHEHDTNRNPPYDDDPPWYGYV